jgi:predicted DNA binding CopG/RHH family protein
MALRNYQPQNAMLTVRLRQDELGTIKKAAKTAGFQPSEIIRTVLLAWAKRKLKTAK